jgi:hypothetical protein
MYLRYRDNSRWSGQNGSPETIRVWAAALARRSSADLPVQQSTKVELILKSVLVSEMADGFSRGASLKAGNPAVLDGDGRGLACFETSRRAR